MRPAVIPVRGKHQFFPIRRKHRERIEITLGSDLFQSASVQVNHEELEIVTAVGEIIAGENDSPAIGREKRCPVGFAEVRNLPEIAAVDIADIYFHIGRSYQSLRQELFIFGHGFWRFRP